MAVSDKHTPTPTEIKLHQKSRALEITYADGKTFTLPCEFLRVHSPSAEVRGHGPGQEVLQAGKREVNISRIEPVGTYAVQLYFSDGHVKVELGLAKGKEGVDKRRALADRDARRAIERALRDRERSSNR